MADATKKPVIFLAFANSRDDKVDYLRNLPVEARRLRDALKPAEQAGLCEVEVRTDCSAGDIFGVFQDSNFRNRIAIFHYGGHANDYQLLLESEEGKAAAADAGGLAAFLAQQQGLQLVFLNGCSTQQQTEGLLDANISVVVSTSRAIDDQVATDFSCQFYQGLAGGASIHTAYREAGAAVQTTRGGNTRGLYFGDVDKPEDLRNADGFPWKLHLRDASEGADQWTLREAADDPLFGLPSLPKQVLPKSPYRHLAWFTTKDAELFFGRGHQIRELYEGLTAEGTDTEPILLLYGQSGVGKSSILDAGLLPRLEQHYRVRYLRRGEGGLLDTLKLAFLPEAGDVPIETAWREKEKDGDPLIVFLDQVEDLYTRPLADMPNEVDQFLKVLKAIFNDPVCRPRGKLVLGFRKEWLAELEAQLDHYELSMIKIFLEPLDRRGIIEVVQGPADSNRLVAKYGLTVENGLAEIIADDLLTDRGSAIAPTLQILLTKMWDKAKEANDAHPQFTQDLYQQLKRDGILLRDFLKQQIATFQQRFPEAVKSGLLLDLLALHTTPMGTADQRSVEQLQQQYSHQEATLSDILKECQNLHLLTVVTNAQKENVNTTRLAHDTLAPIVREQFDQSDKPGQRARRILDARVTDWLDERIGTSLDEFDLQTVETGLAGTRKLTADESRLVESSRQARTRRRSVRWGLLVATASAVAVILILARVTEQQNRQLAKQYSVLDAKFKLMSQGISVIETEAGAKVIIPAFPENFRREIVPHLKTLEVRGLTIKKGVFELDGLFELTTIEELVLGATASVKTLNPLKNLRELKVLSLSSCGVTDLQPLVHNNSALEILTLKGSEISDIKPLERLAKLETLSITSAERLEKVDLECNGGGFSSLTSLLLDSCGKLKSFRFANHSAIRDLQVTNCIIIDDIQLGGLVALTSANVSNNISLKTALFEKLRGLNDLSITDCKALELMTIDAPNLLHLYLPCQRETPLRDFKWRGSLNSLITLELQGREVDLDSIAGCGQLEVLKLSNTTVSDLEVLGGLTTLELIDLRHTRVADLRPLSNMAKLKTLLIDNTKVDNLDALKNVKSLVMVTFDSTQVTSVEPLMELPALEVVSHESTSISEEDKKRLNENCSKHK